MKTTYLIIIMSLSCIKLSAQTSEETFAVEKITAIFNELNGNIFNQEKLELIQKNLMQLSFENEVLFTKTNYLDPENYINFYADNRVFNYADFMERAFNKLITVEIDKTSLYSSDRLDANFMIYIDLYFRNDSCELIENYLTIHFHYGKINIINEHANTPVQY
jgi:hypothetical protein